MKKEYIIKCKFLFYVLIIMIISIVSISISMSFFFNEENLVKEIL